jgi:glycosyltransferase involved in cell wall biosynthesis
MRYRTELEIMPPKVSVIIPTYNRADKVRNAIESVLAQTAPDLEVIVVDDGSSDGTELMLRELYGGRIRYFTQANQGVSVARNRGIAEAKGEWIAFLDSDDLWEKEKLEWQFKALDRFTPECGGCYTDTGLLNHSETRTLFEMAEEGFRHEEMMGVNKEVLRLLVRPGGGGMLVCPSSLLARADAVRETGGFDPRLKFSEDSEFLFRLAMITGFCYVNRPLVRKDQGPVESRHIGVAAEWNKLEFVLRQSQMRLEGLLRLTVRPQRSIHKLIRKQLGSTHSGLANCYLEAGQYTKARQAVSRAVQFDLTPKVALKWLLTWVSPTLARRTVRRHLDRKANSVPVL